jgi:glutathione synthase/RimK-type ligase-like ATP-grasp enzyme
MTTVGMLHYRLDPRKVFKTYAYASVAKAEGVDFFYFTPGRVNLEEKTIKAWVLENGEWFEKMVPFPDVIYNAGAPTTDKQYEIHEKLSQQIPFTSHPIGDKLTVYRLVRKHKEFSQYLLPTEKITSFRIVEKMLERFQTVVLKPVSSHKGLGVVFIKQDQINFIIIIREGDSKKLGNTEELIEYVRSLTQEREYLVQPFIQCKTKYGLAFDFRLHVQKNGQGKWVITMIYPRIACSGKLVTNLNCNGYTGILECFLAEEFGDYDYNIKRYLEQFALQFAEHLDKIYDQSLDELGIDVGLDSNHKIWIYEVNWRPGLPVTFNLELDVARNTIQYAVYLAKIHLSEKLLINPKTRHFSRI